MIEVQSICSFEALIKVQSVSIIVLLIAVTDEFYGISIGTVLPEEIAEGWS